MGIASATQFLVVCKVLKSKYGEGNEVRPKESNNKGIFVRSITEFIYC